MSQFNLTESEMMDFEELENELARTETAALQARVIQEQGRDIFRSIMALDDGLSPAQRLRKQKQLLTKLHALLSSGALSDPLREPVGEEHLKLIQFYNAVVRPQDSFESSDVTPEEIQGNSQSDEDDTTESMSEDDEDSVIVIDSSSDEEFEPEDEAVARDNDYRDAFLSRETDSESEDEDRFRNLNVFYI